MRPICEECEFFSCICEINKSHKEKCKFRIAATCPIGIECDEHRRDVCPICDPCTCNENEQEAEETTPGISEDKKDM